ncbi:MAG: hypothetical protein KF752_06040 [Pirellulaceae bacterium]|nr:hypothetical protein [Pirellulaceae bacterium]
MWRLYRTSGSCLTAVLTLCLNSSTVLGEHPVHFPWGTHYSAPPIPTAQPHSYRTLSSADRRETAATVQPNVLQILPAKSAYAYGWFGSNPTTQWGRHFGYSKGFTQWTRR